MGKIRSKKIKAARVGTTTTQKSGYGSRFLLNDWIVKIFEDQLAIDDPDFDEMPDDETTEYVSEMENLDAGAKPSIISEEFRDREMPQLANIILHSSAEVEFLSQVSLSTHAEAIRGDILNWSHENTKLIQNNNPLELYQPIPLDQRQAHYDEIQKNSGEILLLLPNLNLIYLKDIYSFRQAQASINKNESTINALVKIYQRLEPKRDFSGLKRLYDHEILTIKGIKGHQGKYGLTMREIRKFFEFFIQNKKQFTEYKTFENKLKENFGTDKMEKFLNNYGEELWRILKK